MYYGILCFPESDVMNLISVDCPNLQKALRFMHFPWSCPLQISISLFFLYDILDGAMIPGRICKPLLLGKYDKYHLT